MNLAQQLQQLYSEFGDIDGINIELHKDLVAIAVNNQAAKALVFLQGAQVAEYQAEGCAKTLWLSDCNLYQQGQPLRGGIPISWPWFGNLAENPSAITRQFESLTEGNGTAQNHYPAHGFARNTHWQLNSVSNINEKQTQLQLSLDIEADFNPSWPFASQLQLTILVGEQLSLSLEVTNNSQQSFSYSSALHSYFAVGHINQARLKGLEEQRYIDKTNQQSFIQQGPISIESETDRVYVSSQEASNSTPPLQLQDSNQQTTLTSQGSRSTVVWNPWQDKAKQLSCFNDSDYQRMLCIETANAGDDFVTLAPGQNKRLSVTIKPKAL